MKPHRQTAGAGIWLGFRDVIILLSPSKDCNSVCQAVLRFGQVQSKVLIQSYRVFHPPGTSQNLTLKEGVIP